MHELFDHTADLGLRAEAADLGTLFAEMGRALTAAIVERPGDIREEAAADFAVEGADREYLLFDFLRELLGDFEMTRRVFGRFEVAVTDAGLTATAWGEELDPDRHGRSHEVKAITYHDLLVEPIEGGGWRAEVIIDI